MSAKTLPDYELDELRAAFRGKIWAVTAVSNDKPPFRLGVAIANEPGHSPVPLGWAWAETWPGMYGEAMRINALLGWTEEQALNIIATTMRPITPSDPTG